jgi:decaprenyl-phosphate phosphoribosyltransferase
MELFISLLKTVRPRQWLKNLALFAALIFSGLLFTPGYFILVLNAVFVFTILASCTYVFNDILDIESDKKHPFKKKRPIASGKLPLPLAVFFLISGLIIGLYLSYSLGFFFFIIILVYLGMQLLYTLWLKTIPIVDVIIIAVGYILRVYAGAFVINAHLDVWILLAVISAALFLAIGKRRSELTLLKGQKRALIVRATLGRYTESLLDVYTAMFANSTWLTYALFTFNHPPIVPDGKVLTLMSFLPKTLLSEKLLMATTPLVIFGVMRYLQLIYEKNEGESPERILLSDKPLMITIFIWGLMTVGILYLT